MGSGAETGEGAHTTPDLKQSYLGPPKSITQTASQSISSSAHGCVQQTDTDTKRLHLMLCIVMLVNNNNDDIRDAPDSNLYYPAGTG